MPELPEVETIRLGLQKYLVGKKLESVDLKLPRIVKGGRLEDLVGSTVSCVRRFGKVLVLDFNPSTGGRAPTAGLSLVVHIKLTGQIIYRPDESKVPNVPKVSKAKVGTLPNKWTHMILGFSDGTKLYYNDLRQFGWIRVIPTKSVESFKFIQELGPEPFGELTAEKFKEIICKKKTKIKPLLLDQTLIGGVGNIYANDALNLAKIDPRRPANSLSESEQIKLYEALLEVLGRGLKYGGASELTYVNSFGEEGKYQEHFLVYARTGKPCKNCGESIKKIMLAGRGTFYCENCQK